MRSLRVSGVGQRGVQGNGVLHRWRHTAYKVGTDLTFRLVMFARVDTLILDLSRCHGLRQCGGKVLQLMFFRLCPPDGFPFPLFGAVVVSFSVSFGASVVFCPAKGKPASLEIVLLNF